jgi:glutathione synthase/RimK-type ligase-like ATP-grasp enzyme/ribosomal protein S18 acetylase RimI-like enzyme
MPIREAQLNDLSALIDLENKCFDADKRQSQTSIKRSIKSEFQDIFVLEELGHIIGSMTLYRYKKSIRLYSIAVSPEFQGQGLGKLMMAFLMDFARQQAIEEITLEVEIKEAKLVSFYEKLGFVVESELSDYYGQGRNAYAMRLKSRSLKDFKKMPNQLIVVETIIPWLKDVTSIPVIQAEDYIKDPQYLKKNNLKVFNLCQSYAYQSLGYYVSLMATARNHRVVPNVATLNDFSDPLIITSFGEEADAIIQSTLSKESSNTLTVTSIFGFTPHPRYEKMLKSLFNVFEAPFVAFTFEKGRRWKVTQAKVLSFADVDDNPFLKTATERYFQQKRMGHFRLKDYLYDLAILYDPDEQEPPSNRTALAKFKTTAQKYGFYVEFITKDDYARLTEFDALLIRTTTNVNDISYQFSRYAYAEGLVVLDDPWSILKCSNKLFFTESMKKIGLDIPKTMFISQYTTLEEIHQNLAYPIVLKQPDSAFSLGVFKVQNDEELTAKLTPLLNASALVVAQSFIPSAFDWRIGVIDGKPFYACQYYMAHNHWQILNWHSKKRKDREGSVVTLPLEEVPSFIIDAAVKAAKAMGDGLYGVDLKEHDGKAYVIEVNDNPSIDHGYEDAYYKDALYHTIIKTMFDRIESARGHVKTKA